MKKAIFLAALILGGCEATLEEEAVVIPIDIISDGQTRSNPPDEEKLTDINVYVFSENDILEEHIYCKWGENLSARLLKNKTYSFFVCANIGWKLNCASRAELEEYSYWFTWPDDYRNGIPMTGCLKEYTIRDSSPIAINLERTMAKISVRLDRRQLSPDVKIIVRSVKIGGCPKSVKLFRQNFAGSRDDVFASGYARSEEQVGVLNYDTADRISGTVDLYLAENRQGDIMADNQDEKKKWFGEYDPRTELCSYLEIKSEYYSEKAYTQPEKYLIYRIFLGDGPGNFDVCRNCSYSIAVAPKGDGLDGEGWMIEKDGIILYDDIVRDSYFRVYPANYIECSLGDVIHVGCEYSPPDAEIDIGIEDMEYDRERGIYDFVVDPDGKGATLTMKKKGTGIIHYAAGNPINKAENIIIVCEP